MEKLKIVTFENELYDIQNITLSTDLRIGTELYSICVDFEVYLWSFSWYKMYYDVRIEV